MKFMIRAQCAIILAAVLCVPASAAVLDIKALSSRPDRVSGGDVLLRITQSDDAATPVTLNGTDVSKAFGASSAPHSRDGLVKGLKLGVNMIAAGGKSLSIKNYPITGPIVSGPLQTPYFCTTGQFPIFSGATPGLLADKSVFNPPTDKNCSAPTKITYLYLAKGATDLKRIADPAKPPADVAMTTTSAGVTMPFIVRLETSTVDRGIYQSTVLYDAKSDSGSSWRNPPRGWNRRLITITGTGCPGGWYFQGMKGGSIVLDGFDASIFSPARLGQGYTLMGNTLMNPSQSCNQVLAGEAAVMSREHFIKTVGVPELNLAIGCSGGSYSSAQLGDQLPGLFDGILISCTFPDPVTIAFSGLDGHLLTHYFMLTPAGRKFTEAQQVAVSGYQGKQAWIDAANQAGRTDPVGGRKDVAGYLPARWNDSVPKNLYYDPKTNPKGLRPTIFDDSKNIYGTDPKSGFANRTFDNIGVQYGLAALNDKTISVDQFLDLNEGVGGYDQDASYVPQRSAANTQALKRAYQAGLILDGGAGLSTIPVFDVSGIMRDEAGYHYQWFHYALRDRLARANGNADNHVMWRGKPVPFEKAFAAFSGWAESVHKDGSARSQRAKVIAGRPKNLVDGCWRDAGSFVAEKQVVGHEPSTACNKLFPNWTNPRFIAGSPIAYSIIKCQTKPVSEADYKVAFTAAQMGRAKKIFAGGVCDWSKPGVSQVKVVPWASFGPAPENMVFDVTKAG